MFLVILNLFLVIFNLFVVILKVVTKLTCILHDPNPCETSQQLLVPTETVMTKINLHHLIYSTREPPKLWSQTIHTEKLHNVKVKQQTGSLL